MASWVYLYDSHHESYLLHRHRDRAAGGVRRRRHHHYSGPSPQRTTHRHKLVVRPQLYWNWTEPTVRCVTRVGSSRVRFFATRNASVAARAAPRRCLLKCTLARSWTRRLDRGERLRQYEALTLEILPSPDAPSDTATPLDSGHTGHTGLTSGPAFWCSHDQTTDHPTRCNAERDKNSSASANAETVTFWTRIRTVVDHCLSLMY